MGGSVRNKMGWRGFISSGSGQGQLAGSGEHEHGNESSGPIKRREFLG